MDQTTKSRHVVNHYSYENCAPLFDALKGEAKFFESEADFQMKIVKQTNRAYPDLKWKPAMIKGEHWIPALMNTMWRFRFDVITHRNFFEKDGLNADEGVLNLVIKECFKLSEYDKSEEYQRICKEQPNTLQQPWNFWLNQSLMLQDSSKADSAYTFRYFCGWLIALLSRTVKLHVQGQGIVRKDEVHVIALTAEDIFIKKLAEKGRQGSLKDAVLRDLPSNFLNLGAERRGRKRRANFQDVDEDVQEESLGGESNLQYLKNLMDDGTKSLTEKKRLAEKIMKEFKSDLDAEVERLDEMGSMMTEIECIVDKESEKFRRSKLYHAGMDKLLKSVGNIGVPNPSTDLILQLKNTLDQYLLTHHGSRAPGSIPVIRERFPDVSDKRARATSVWKCDQRWF